MKKNNCSTQDDVIASKILEKCTVVGGRLILSTQPATKQKSQCAHKYEAKKGNRRLQKNISDLKRKSKTKQQAKQKAPLHNSRPVLESQVMNKIKMSLFRSSKQNSTKKEAEYRGFKSKNKCSWYDAPKSSLEGRTIIKDGSVYAFETIDYGLRDKN